MPPHPVCNRGGVGEGETRVESRAQKNTWQGDDVGAAATQLFQQSNARRGTSRDSECFHKQTSTTKAVLLGRGVMVLTCCRWLLSPNGSQWPLQSTTNDGEQETTHVFSTPSYPQATCQTQHTAVRMPVSLARVLPWWLPWPPRPSLGGGHAAPFPSPPKRSLPDS